jgi:AraC-like DNA-binding protein
LIVVLSGRALRRFDGADDCSGRWLCGGLLRRRLDCLEAALSQRLRADASSDPLIRHAALALAAGASASAVQRASGCAPATFIARYRAACGLAPKRHASLMRFQAALRGRDDRRPWADVAAAAGYADQAHLTRTFARLAGMTPTQYRAASTFDRHVAWR